MGARQRLRESPRRQPVAAAGAVSTAAADGVQPLIGPVLIVTAQGQERRETPKLKSQGCKVPSMIHHRERILEMQVAPAGRFFSRGNRSIAALPIKETTEMYATSLGD